MKGYKVVRHFNGELFSCNMNFYDDSTLRLKYEVGKVTIAPKGTLGIFVFLDIQHARNFIEDGGNRSWVIYEAELLTKPVPRKEVLQDYIVPANSFLCRKIKVIGLAKERC